MYFQIIRKEKDIPDESSSSCLLCNHRYRNLNNNICDFCNTIINYETKLDIMKKCFMMHSELTQKEIINKTFNYIQKHHKIPLPKDIDENCYFFKKSHYEIFDDLLNKKNDNIKFFFSDKFSLHNFIFKSFNTNIKKLKDLHFFIQSK